MPVRPRYFWWAGERLTIPAYVVEGNGGWMVRPPKPMDGSERARPAFVRFGGDPAAALRRASALADKLVPDNARLGRWQGKEERPLKAWVTGMPGVQVRPYRRRGQIIGHEVCVTLGASRPIRRWIPRRASDREIELALAWGRKIRVQLVEYRARGYPMSLVSKDALMAALGPSDTSVE